jgi:hypothetical protein
VLIREHHQVEVAGFVDQVAAAIGAANGLAGRVGLLLPVYRVKWCCIMLNEFLPAGSMRRSFARTDDSPETRQMSQLQKVEAALSQFEA